MSFKNQYLNDLGLTEKDFKLSNVEGLDKVYYQKALLNIRFYNQIIHTSLHSYSTQ